jgi:hypothetical protein
LNRKRRAVLLAGWSLRKQQSSSARYYQVKSWNDKQENAGLAKWRRRAVLLWLSLRRTHDGDGSQSQKRTKALADFKIFEL